MPTNILVFILFVLAILAITIYLSTTNRRKVKKAQREPFPDDSRKLLERKVSFYKELNATDKQEFEKRVQGFLALVDIQGAGMKVNEQTKLLVAASAVIPLFEWPQWRYAGLREIFIYPHNFDADFNAGKNKNILGLVGNSGMINHLMILSKPALEHGFEHPKNQRHVGFHEFAHLLDRADGVIDGIPAAFLPEEKINPWIKLVHKEMARIRKGHSDINPYALKNESEFFAVVCEYYLEHPEKMEKRHPELFGILELVFNDKENSEK